MKIKIYENEESEKIVVYSNDIVSGMMVTGEEEWYIIPLCETFNVYNQYGSTDGYIIPEDGKLIYLSDLLYVEFLPEDLNKNTTKEEFEAYCDKIGKTTEEVANELEIVVGVSEVCDIEDFVTIGEVNRETFCLYKECGFEFIEEIEGEFLRGETNIGDGAWSRIFKTDDGREIEIAYSQYNSVKFDWIVE